MASAVVEGNGLLTYLGLRIQGFLGWERRRGVQLHGYGIVIRTASPDLGVAHESLGGEYAALARLFPRDMKGLIIDAGGYIGTAALALSAMYPSARVVTIEPSSENIMLLRKNTGRNSKIEVIQAALVANGEPSRIALRHPGGRARQWGFSVVVDHEGNAGAHTLEEVDTLTLSDLMQRFGVERIQIAKLDIEGAERNIFRDADTWLDRCDALIVELHERDVPGCETAFESANRKRCVLASGGEKFISIGRGYFEMRGGDTGS